MTALRRPRTTARRWWPEFLESVSFQVVVMPSLLALITIGFVDLWGEPWWAFGFTIVVALVALFLSLVAFRRRERRLSAPVLSDGSASDRSFAGLVFSPSAPRKEEERRFENLVAKLRDVWEPRFVVCVCTPAAEKAAWRIVQRVFEGRAEVWKEVLADGDEVDPSAIARSGRSAIDRLTRAGRDRGGLHEDDVLVDITAGTKVLSLGLYTAAVEENVNVGYLADLAADHPKTSILLRSSLRADDVSTTWEP